MTVAEPRVEGKEGWAKGCRCLGCSSSMWRVLWSRVVGAPLPPPPPFAAEFGVRIEASGASLEALVVSGEEEGHTEINNGRWGGG